MRVIDPLHLDTEQRARLTLLRSQRIGPVSYYQLIHRFGSAERAIAALPDIARRSGGKMPRLAKPAEIDDEIEALAKAKARYLFHNDPLYPPWLAASPTPPPILMVAGEDMLLTRPAIAMVGARNASAAACRLARKISAELAEAGYLIVSGLARGIDAAAHWGATDIAAADQPIHSTGIIASGIDIAYPPGNEALQALLAQRGLVIAEHPPKTQPIARHFPSRNRIIAGMSIATLVVEAAPRSGSLITARLAGELGREVMAIPGSPLDARSQGCNGLIREGAILVQSAEDIIELIAPFAGGERQAPPLNGSLNGRLLEDQGGDFEYFGLEAELQNGAAPDPPNDLLQDDLPQDDPLSDAQDPQNGHRTLIELLGASPVPVDELVRQSDLPTAQVQTLLMDLEISGQLERHAGNKVSLRLD